MLEELRIRDLAVIEEAVLEFAPGLTVITGETGAGKTMVVQGLGLLLGERADPGRVRPGADRAVVEARLQIGPEHPAVPRVLDAGGLIEDGTLLLSRTLSAEGRSRAAAGGTAVPVAVLGELTAALVAVHGQSDQQRLLRPGQHRALLDGFAGRSALEPLAEFSTGWARLRELEAELTELAGSASERAREAELLRLGLAEVAAVEPVPGEDAELAAEAERLAHADALRTAAAAAHDLLAGESPGGGADLRDQLGAARRALEAGAVHDPGLAELAQRVAEVGYLITELVTDLAGYAAGIEADPVRLAAVHGRQAQLAGLRRRYAADLAGVLSWAEQASARLAELTDDGRADRLAGQVAGLRERLGRCADRLSSARAAAAERLGPAVAAELAALAMPHARLQAVVAQRADPAGLPVGDRRQAAGPSGVDEVEFRLAAHPGAPARPLARAASGGELSRVMLALEVVLAAPTLAGGAGPTLVFDEVDAGVGGRAAVEVGRRLARLAERVQVVAVTHLPQVAAYADRHLVVSKTSAGRVTSAGVAPVTDGARVRELSRMLAGLADSRHANQHAAELLAAAAASKAG